MTEFQQWLEAQEMQEAMIILKESNELVIDIPKEDRAIESHTEQINCNKCPSGHTDMLVMTSTINITVKTGDLYNATMLSRFSENVQNIFMQLVEKGAMLPRWRRGEDKTLEQLQENGEYTTNFGEVV